ncbi:amino acid permease [bacterium SCSIO 12696]|nr:amino acid permease [bacterium SCSIO 12696]
MVQENQFSRVLNGRDTLTLAFGAMIGWGWVVLAGDWVETAGTLGAVVAFVIGGALVCLIACTYAELATAMPKAGGEHVYSHRALGNFGSFICTWTIILGYVSVSAFEAVALPTVLDHIFDFEHLGHLWQIAGSDVYFTWALIGSLGAVLVTVVNIFGVKPAAFLQTVLVTLLIAGGLMLMTGSVVGGNTENLTPLFADGFAGVSAVIIMVPFMLVGFDVIPQAAEEINLPFKKIGKTLLAALALAVAWYVLIILSVSLALPAEQIANAELVTAAASEAGWNSKLAGTFLVIAGVGGIITSWNAFMVGGSRAIFAMARAKQLPGFLAYLHPKHNTPVNAILLIGVLSALAPLLGSKALVWFVNAGGLGIVIAYGFVALSFLVLRKNEPEMERPYKLKYGNTVGFLALAAAVGLVALYLPGSPSALVWPWEWLIFIGWSLLGFVFYTMTKR